MKFEGVLFGAAMRFDGFLFAAILILIMAAASGIRFLIIRKTEVRIERFDCFLLIAVFLGLFNMVYALRLIVHKGGPFPIVMIILGFVITVISLACIPINMKEKLREAESTTEENVFDEEKKFFLSIAISSFAAILAAALGLISFIIYL